MNEKQLSAFIVAFGLLGMGLVPSLLMSKNDAVTEKAELSLAVTAPAFILPALSRSPGSPAATEDPAGTLKEDLRDQQEDSSVIFDGENFRSGAIVYGGGPLTAYVRMRATPPPSFSARIVILTDLETGEEYFKKNPDMRWPLASITKLMTAAVASEMFSPDTQITLTEEDLSVGGNSHTKDMVPGMRFKAGDLLAAMLLTSSNEAASAFARIGGPGFIVRMNAKSAEWGLLNTHFSEPTGISASNQSTARDLVMLARTLWREKGSIMRFTTYPSLNVRAELVSTSTEALPKALTLALSNTNEFAGRRYFLGGKTGLTPEAGGNLLSVFSYGGRSVVAIVLGSDDRFGESESLYNWFIHDFVASH